jgi:hypothetical protein
MRLMTTASRMESSGTVGRIHVTSETSDLGEDRFRGERRGVEVKGKALHGWVVSGGATDAARAGRAPKARGSSSYR